MPTRDELQGLTPNSLISRTRGPLGIADYADPNVKFCKSGDTQGPVGTNGDSAGIPVVERIELKVCELSMEGVGKSLWSVAYNVAIDEQTVVKGGFSKNPFGTNLSMGAAIALFVGGTKTVDTADRKSLELRAKVLVSQYTTQFAEAFANGPKATCDFLMEMSKKRVDAKASIEKKFSEAMSYNSDVEQAINKLGVRTASIKFAATVIFKALPLAKGGSLLMKLGLSVGDVAYDVSIDVIDDLSKAKNADAILISAEDKTKDTAKDEAIEYLGEVVTTGAEAWESHVTKLNSEIIRVQKQLELGRSNRKKTIGQAKKLGKLEARAIETAGSPKGLAKLASRAGMITTAAKGIGFFVLAADTCKAFETYAKDAAMFGKVVEIPQVCEYLPGD